MNALAFVAAAFLAAPQATPSPTPSPLPEVLLKITPALGQLPDLVWKTYVVDLSNTAGRDLDLVVHLGESGGAGRAQRRERLPAGSHKRLFFYLINRYSGRLSYKIEDTAGRVIVEDSLQEEYRRTMSTSTSPLALGLALMDRMPVLKGTTADLVLCPESSLPDRWIGLEGFQFAIMRDYKLDALMPAQRAALLEWIRRGNTLFVYAGANRDWLTTRAVQDLAPVALGPSSELTKMDALESSFGEFRERTSFVYHRITNGTPISDAKPAVAHRFPQGAGQVVVIPFDLERAPFDSWPGGPKFRDYLLTQASRQPGGPPWPRLGEATPQIREAATETVTTMPSFLVLLAISIVYIIVVGPVNYLLLRRLNKTLLIVVTIPAISMFFMIVVVGAGQLIRGTSTVAFDVCLLEAQAGDDTAVENRLLCVQSASNRSYDLEWPGETAATVGAEAPKRAVHGWYYNEQEAEIRGIFDQTDHWALRDCAFSQWQTAAFLGRTTRPLGGSVTFSANGEELTIRNHSSLPILRGVLVDGAAGMLLRGEVQLFEGVGAGETKTFRTMRKVAMLPSEEAASLEDRILRSWMPGALGQAVGRQFLVCVLAPPADEIRMNAGRAPSSERVCLLQVLPDRP